MKNLKSFTESLKSNAILNNGQQKEIKGGYYYSYEECSIECQTGGAGFPPGHPFPPGPGVPPAGGCWEERPGYWSCMDS